MKLGNRAHLLKSLLILAFSYRENQNETGLELASGGHFCSLINIREGCNKVAIRKRVKGKF